MRRLALLIIAGCSSAAADSAPKPLPARLPATGCLEANSPAIVALQTEVARRSQLAYDAAIAKLGIQRTTLASQAPTVINRGVVQTTRGTFVVSDVPLGELGHANGKVFPLRPSAATASTTTVVICGCAPQYCAMPSPVYRAPRPDPADVLVMYGPLPTGSTYVAEPRAVEFSSPSMTFEYARTCPRKSCDPPK